MSSLYQSKPKLRTQTGCLECRKRRKKCDEHKPRCNGCSRNSLSCTWPTTVNRTIDKRLYPWSWKSRRQRTNESSSSFQPTDHFALFTHFTTAVLPKLVRQACRPEYSHQTHMIRLAHDFPPLMAIMIGTAALDKKSPVLDQLAVESYLFSLHGLRERMARVSNPGDDDAVLATMIFLCIFENLRPDAQPNISLHATAAGVLLTQRQSVQEQSSTQPIAVFERVCAESFLYHSSLMMLFDPFLDALADIDSPSKWSRYFSSSTKVDACLGTHPVLDAPYEYFLLVAGVTRLARLSRPLYGGEVERWKQLESQLCQYEQTPGHDAWKALYLVAMRILLLKVHPILPIGEAMDQIQGFLHDGLSIINALHIQNRHVGYLIWPLAVLGSIAVDPHDRAIVKTKIVNVAETGHGLAIRIWNRIQHIWASSNSEKVAMTMRGLCILMTGPGPQS